MAAPSANTSQMTEQRKTQVKPCKYLGKLYVDRTPGSRPNQTLLYKAVKVIKEQAPAKHKPQVAFMTTKPGYANGRTLPSALICKGLDGVSVMKCPVLTIVSVGHTNKSFVFVTVEPKDATQMRFWVHAFGCKSADHAAFTASQLIKACSASRSQYIKAKEMSDKLQQSRLGPDLNLQEPSYLTGNMDFSRLMAENTAPVDLAPINLGACLQADASTFFSAPPEGGDGMSTNEMDVELSTEVLEEMYDLNCSLQEYNIKVDVRGKLLDAWQRGLASSGVQNTTTPPQMSSSMTAS